MYKKHFVLIGCVLIGTILALFMLFSLTKIPNSENNGFKRKWLSKSLSEVNREEIDKSIFRICGETNQHYFLAGRNPQVILLIKKNLQPSDTQVFNIKLNESIISRNSLSIDSPNVILEALNYSKFYFGKLNNVNIDSSGTVSSLIMRSAILPNNKVIARCFDNATNHQNFQVIDLKTGQAQKKSSVVESKDLEDWDSDGMLKYDSTNNRLIYIQFFKNKFYCFDTSLNLLYSANTIDTIKSNAFTYKTIKEKDGEKLVPTTPRFVSNKLIQVNEGYIYVLSGVRSDDESLNDFRDNSSFDVYKSEDGQYIGSFSIPNIEKEKPIDFKVNKSEILVLYKGYISTYNLNRPFISPNGVSYIK